MASLNLKNDHSRLIDVDGYQVLCHFYGEEEDMYSAHYTFWFEDMTATIKSKFGTPEGLENAWLDPDFNQKVADMIRAQLGFLGKTL